MEWPLTIDIITTRGSFTKRDLRLPFVDLGHDYLHLEVIAALESK